MYFNITLQIVCLFLSFFSVASEQQKKESALAVMGNHFLTFNTVIRVNQIEVSKTRSVGQDERALHTPERVIAFRNAFEDGFPGGKMTWSFSWLALKDTSAAYREIRKLVVGYHYKYGDEITFIPGAYFANAYNTIEQANQDLHDALKIITSVA